MSATAIPRPQAGRRRGLKGLAGALAFVCLVLFLLAIEQKQAVQVWAALRDGAIPAAGRIFHWAADGASDGLDGLKTAAVGTDGPLTAAPDAVVLAGEFDPADDVTRDTTGGVTFTGAVIRLERGETFATRLDAAGDAQIELRAVVPQSRGQAVAASPLCGGAAPGVAALLHRRDHVELMLFRERTIVGPDAPVDGLCGVWRFRAR